jgi:hypothetical protein
MFNGEVGKALGGIQPPGPFERPGGAGFQAARAVFRKDSFTGFASSTATGGGQDFRQKNIGSVAGHNEHVVFSQKPKPDP